MAYLELFSLLSIAEEERILDKERRTCFESCYPFKIFPQKNIKMIECQDITIFSGSNGSGKSTLLNIIAGKIKTIRKQHYNKSEFFDKYLRGCYFCAGKRPVEMKLITSDDIFNYLFDIRAISRKDHKKRMKLASEYQGIIGKKLKTLEELEIMKDFIEEQEEVKSFYKKKLNNNIKEQSNGELALIYFERELKKNGLYLLDEPENSLSAISQIKMMKLIDNLSKKFKCQFIISTHSPFLLSLENALIYNLDSETGKNVEWNQLENVKTYYNFFKEHETEFK